jgi:SAM-dependent methyltransferase
LVDWRLGDVTDLPLADDKFSVVLSVFGVMYAQDEHAVAVQLARCCDQGTRIVLTAWSPGSFMPEMGSVLAPFRPSSTDGGFSSSGWGDEKALASMFGQYGVALLETHNEQLVFDFPDSDVATDCLMDTAGHVVRERQRLEREGRWSAIRDELRSLECQTSTPAHRASAPARAPTQRRDDADRVVGLAYAGLLRR